MPENRASPFEGSIQIDEQLTGTFGEIARKSNHRALPVRLRRIDGNGIFSGNRWLLVSTTILAVLILLLTSLPTEIKVPGNSGARLEGGTGPAESTPFFPYLSNATTYPMPDTLPNDFGSTLLPQLSEVTAGGIPIIALAYVHIDVWGNHIIEFRTATYNVTIAQSIAHGNCQPGCPTNLPFQWAPPIPVATFGLSPIQELSMATGNSLGFDVAIAASSNNSTELFVSAHLGAIGTWYSLTGPNPVWGYDPQVLLATGCLLYVTTLGPMWTNVTQFSIPNFCNIPSIAGGPGGGGGQHAVQPPGGQGPLGPSTPAAVSSVAAVRATRGTSVTISGSGFSTVQQVLFGGAAAAFNIQSSSSIQAVVPPGAGSVNVSVWNPLGWSATNCSDVFSYGTTLPTGVPQVEWVSPESVGSGSTVYVGGLNLGQVTGVTFGTTQATFHLISGTKISATVPTGAGAVSVTVTSSVGSSLPTCASVFRYNSPSEPVVNSLSPVQGQAGSSVTINGGGFLSNSSVAFGTTPATQVSYVSSSQLSATVPSGLGTVPVIVAQWGFQSPSSCGNLFTYGSSSGPLLTGVAPTQGSSGTSISVSGSNLQNTATILVGGLSGGTVGGVGSVPEGYGPVSVIVGGSNGVTPQVCADRFTIFGPSLPPLPPHYKVVRVNASLPGVFSGAVPVRCLNPLSGPVSGGVLQVLAINVSAHPGLQWFNVSFLGPGASIVSKSLFPVNESAGSPIFDAVGSTRLTTTFLAPGGIAAAANGAETFIAMTTNEGGRTAVATLVSANNGTNWSGPYLSAATVGSVADPQVVESPTGSVFVAWLQGGPGDWQVGLAVYAPSGSLLLAPELLPGAGGTAATSASNLTLTVDPFMRPVLAWASPNGSGSYRIEYSGALLSPRLETKSLWAGFNVTVPADFENFGGSGLSNFRSRVNGLFSSLETALTGGQLCSAQQLAYELYGNLTWIERSPYIANPGACGIVGPDNSLLANTRGLSSPNVYLSVGAELLLESLGAAIMPIPEWQSLGWQNPSSPPGPFVPGTPGVFRDRLGDVVTTSPWTLTPDALWLNTSSSFPGQGAVFPETYAGKSCGTYSWTDYPILFQAKVKIGSTGTFSPYFTSSNFVPSIYVTNVTSMQGNVQWTEQLLVTFQTVNESLGACPASSGWVSGIWVMTTPPGWISTLQPSLTGTFTTGLDPFPAMITLNSTAGTISNTMNDTLNWTNTIAANANIWLNSTGCPSCNVHWSNASYQLTESASGQGLQAVTAGKTYTLSFQIASSSGLLNSTWAPLAYENFVSVPAPPIIVPFSCTLVQLSNPVRIWVNPGGPVTGVTGSSANLTWYSASPGYAWVTYNTTDGGLFSQQAQVITLQNGSAEYVAELHDLEPWSLYSATGHLKESSVCSPPNSQVGITVNYGASSLGMVFQTNAQIPLEEQDNPFDSLTGQGGGSTLYWRIPTWFVQRSSFQNGSIIYYPTSNRSDVVTMPLSPPLPAIYGIPKIHNFANAANTTYGLNLTGLSANTTYVVNMTLNFLERNGPLITGVGEPYNFTYQKESTGDGLTDWEKLYGWTFAYQTDLRQWINQQVGANPSLYATNGLVNDYVEKELGLNPSTVDTAGSHMLDTWNLTFNLAPGHGNLPGGSNFRLWYENSSYNPFSRSVSYSPGKYETGRPIAQNLSNVSASPAGGRTSGDGASWAAQTMWSYTALETFVNLSGVLKAGWLRATEGAWDGLQTLTVEGKLSWGANPLAQSTVNDFVTDGMKVDPAAAMYLNVTVNSWDDRNVSQGDGVAAFIRTMSRGAQDVGNYTQQVTAGVLVGVGYRSLYGGNLGESYNFPVNDSMQFATLNVSLVHNRGGTLYNEVNLGPISVDLTNWSGHTARVSGAPHWLNITYQVVPVFSKANTILFLPGDNSTLSPLPIGLQRYTGDQVFDLLTVNDTSASSVIVNGIPYVNASAPNGISRATYSVSLTPGLNNLLVPNSIFIHSPLGQVLLQNRTNASIADTSYNHFLRQSWDPATLQARVLNYSSWNGSNYKIGQPGFIRLYSSPNQNCTGPCGVLPSNPYVSNELPTNAIQAIFAINLTPASYPQLQELLAGLLLNKSGNFTSSAFGATPYLPGLGLSQWITSALANPVLFNAGGFTAPVYSNPNRAGNPWSVLPVLWNSVSGTILGHYLSTLWGGVQAAASFFAYLGNEASQLGAAFVRAATSALKAVAGAIVWALDQFLSAVIWAARMVLSPLTTPISNGLSTYGSQLASTFAQCELDYSATGTVKAADAAAFLAALGGEVFYIILGIGVVVTIALTILSPIGLAATFVVALVFGMIQSTHFAPNLGFLNGRIPGQLSMGSSLTSATQTFASSIGFTNDGSSADWNTFAQTISLQNVELGIFAATVISVALVGSTSTLGAVPIIFGALSFAAAVIYHNTGSVVAKLLALTFMIIAIFSFLVGPKTIAGWAGILFAVGAGVVLS